MRTVGSGSRVYSGLLGFVKALLGFIKAFLGFIRV